MPIDFHIGLIWLLVRGFLNQSHALGWGCLCLYFGMKASFLEDWLGIGIGGCNINPFLFLFLQDLVSVTIPHAFS